MGEFLKPFPVRVPAPLFVLLVPRMAAHGEVAFKSRKNRSSCDPPRSSPFFLPYVPRYETLVDVIEFETICYLLSKQFANVPILFSLHPSLNIANEYVYFSLLFDVHVKYGN